MTSARARVRLPDCIVSRPPSIAAGRCFVAGALRPFEAWRIVARFPDRIGKRYIHTTRTSPWKLTLPVIWIAGTLAQSGARG